MADPLHGILIKPDVQEALESFAIGCQHTERTVFRSHLINGDLDDPMQQDVAIEISLNQHHCSKQGLETRRVIYLAIGHRSSFPCPRHWTRTRRVGPKVPMSGPQVAKGPKDPVWSKPNTEWLLTRTHLN